MSERVIRRGYRDGPHGQIHWRMTGERTGDAPNLYCLHPAPFSGLAFSAIMPHLAQGRLVIAPDFPSHDGSDPFRDDADIAEIESIAQLWERGITRRIESQGIDPSFAMFSEQLRHGRAMHGGFHAGFSYDVEQRLPQVSHQTTIIATQSGLLVATRRAARLMPKAKLVERLDLKCSVLDEAAVQTAKSVLEALQ
jgi:hypothetical protein